MSPPSPSVGPVSPSTRHRHRCCLHPHRTTCTIGSGLPLLGSGLPPPDLDSYHHIRPPSPGTGRTPSDLAAPSRIHVDPLDLPPLELVDPVLNPSEPAVGPRCWSARWLRCGPHRQSTRRPSMGRAGICRRGSGLACPLHRQSSKGTARREEGRCARAQRERGREKLRARRAPRGERRCVALVHLVGKEEVARCTALVRV